MFVIKTKIFLCFYSYVLLKYSYEIKKVGNEIIYVDCDKY